MLYSLVGNVPVRLHQILSHSALSCFLSQAQGFESTLKKNEFGESHRLRTVPSCTALAICTCVHSATIHGTVANHIYQCIWSECKYLTQCAHTTGLQPDVSISCKCLKR
jgi:hypothetical protein